MSQLSSLQTWRQSKWLAVSELLTVVLIFVAAARHLLPLGRMPWLLLLGWISLWLRKIGWRGVGLTLYRSWALTLSLGVALGLLLEGFELFVSQPLLVSLIKKQPDLSQFQALAGNLKLTVLYIALIWIVAAFGEELVYRGYLMNRLADLLLARQPSGACSASNGRTQMAWIISLIVVHVAFGLVHSYQGRTGILDEGLMGVLLGVIYLGAGRNLAVPIVAHGVQDTIDLILIFFRKYPGM